MGRGGQREWVEVDRELEEAPLDVLEAKREEVGMVNNNPLLL